MGALSRLGASSESTAVVQDFHLTDEDFARVRRLIHARAGISLGMQKREMVYSRLSRRLRELRLSDFTTYLNQLEKQERSDEWQNFTNALTTNLTAFFREQHHFPLLAAHVRNARDPVRIWCCAASTGEEPYTIAITLHEALGPKAKEARLLATDIDTQVLDKARRGIYTLDQVEKVDLERRRRFFLRGKGENDGYARVKDELGNMVSFGQLNLLAPDWPLQQLAPFDAIFCRNVMIYFDKPTQAQILKRFAPYLKPGGLLFAGHSENFSYVDQPFRLRGQTVYEVVPGRAAGAVSP